MRDLDLIDRGMCNTTLDPSLRPDALLIPPHAGHPLSAADLLTTHTPGSPSGWVNGADDDGVSFPTTLGTTGLNDDIVGWNFDLTSGGNQFNTQDIDTDHSHGTALAGLIGGLGTAVPSVLGVNSRVSIYPIVAAHRDPGAGTIGAHVLAPADAFADAISYVESLNTRGAGQAFIQVVVVALGHTLVQAGTNLRCGNTDPSVVTKGIPSSDFSHTTMLAEAQFRTLLGAPPFPRALYVIAAGNSSYNLDDSNVYDYPGTTLEHVLPAAQRIIIGSLDTGSTPTRSSFSSYGGNAASGPTLVPLWAPGTWSTLAVGGGAGSGQGTSFAAATVAGAAALLAATNPHFDWVRSGPLASTLAAGLVSTGSPVVSVQCSSGVNSTMQPALDVSNLITRLGSM